jgi:hypothetical protein
MLRLADPPWRDDNAVPPACRHFLPHTQTLPQPPHTVQQIQFQTRTHKTQQHNMQIAPNICLFDRTDVRRELQAESGKSVPGI